MPLLPAVRVLLWLAARAGDPDPAASHVELRAASTRNMATVHRLSRTPPAPASVVDHEVPVAGGTITVRVYTPRGTGPFPAHVYAHGGAFWLGDLDQYDPLCRWYSAKVGCVVVSVDYRLAPEHPYPVPVQDCYAALRWTVASAAELGIDPSRVSIGGSSAGGSLAAATTLMARDRGGPALVFQLLEVPVTDATLSAPSMAEFAEGYLLTRADMERGVGYYLGDGARAREDYASPLLAADLTGLPPALIMTAEFDPLRDEGEAYGRRLAQSGVPVTVTRYAGHVHGSTYLTRLLPSARRFLAQGCAALAAAYRSNRSVDR
ncbi:alpha/beta hydrolase [Pseudonocardia sp. GCM10023141]|uniref:alpha/beta hydrolase n=1 Tax=Pseudonocardia sp. GCM10023141 TaxID=3252653 RepID=UPI00360E1CAE